jgi:hypothetical protein
LGVFSHDDNVSVEVEEAQPDSEEPGISAARLNVGYQEGDAFVRRSESIGRIFAYEFAKHLR